MIQFIIHGLERVLLNEYENTPFQSQEAKSVEGWQAQSPNREAIDPVEGAVDFAYPNEQLGQRSMKILPSPLPSAGDVP